ncbi:hypothetical protein ACQ4PT_047857 [Festuca glaucescens]
MGKRCSPRRGDDSRGRSASRRSSGEQRGKKEQSSISLLVRNISHDCSYDLLAAFQKFGRIRDFYIPKDYYSGEPRGFAFIEFWDSRDASEAQRCMNHKMVCGREINVVRAEGKRKHPDGTPRETRVRGHSDYKGRHVSRHGWSCSRSHSCSPRHGCLHRSRSHSPAQRRHGDYSASPKRKEECQTKSSGQLKEHDKGKKQGLCTPHDRSDRHDADNGSNGRRATPDYSASPKRTEEYQIKSPRQAKKHDEDKRQRSYTPADRSDRWEARNDHDERDDYSTSPKRKEECLLKSPRLSNEHDKDKKRRSCSRDDGNDCCDADIGLKERQVTTGGEGPCARQRSPRPSSRSHSRRRDDYSASPKGKEKHQEQSPRHSKEYDKCKKRRSSTPDIDNRNDRRDADLRHNDMQDDHPTSPKIKEEHQPKSSGESKEYDKDTKRRSYAPHDSNDRLDADNGSTDTNVHVDRKLATLDGDRSHAGRRSPGPSSRLSSRRQDDYSASAKRKEELCAKSPKQSNEHEDEKRSSYTPDERNDRRDADNCNKKKRADYSASPKRKEECQVKSPQQTKDPEVTRRSYTPDDRIVRHEADNGYNERHPSPDNGPPKRTEEPCQEKPHSQSNEHDNDNKQRSYTRDYRKDRCNADNGSKERNDYSASGNKEEEHVANFPRQSKQHDENKKRGSFTPDDRDDHHDTDNGSKERRDDNSASRKRMEDHRAKSPRQSKEHENDKRGSYTHDGRKDHCDADNDSRERRDDYSASGNIKEEHRAKSPRQLKEHDDNKKRGSFTPDDRRDHHDTDNGSKKQDDNSGSRKRMEDHRAKSPRQSKEHENDKNRESYIHDDRKDRCDADNGSRDVPRRRDDNSASRKRIEDRRAKSPRQSKEYENDKKRGSYTHDDRKDHSDAANGSRGRRDDYVSSRKRKEECLGKSPRRSKEHEENKKRGSYAPDDRNDRHDVDRDRNEKLATHDSKGSRPSPRRRSPRPSTGSHSRSGDRTRARCSD